MPSSLKRFEAITRALAQMPRREPATEPVAKTGALHPFDERNIHPDLPSNVRTLFDDGHFAQATFEAFKYLDKYVERHSGLGESGYKLMMNAFAEGNPKLPLTPMKTASEKDEQQGYKFIFVGGVLAIRNPRGHEFSVVDDPDLCLDHLSFVSMLLRRLEQAGYK
jgi:uncharacterized protein (TIGR02391 family)